jgi:hypothetical protein
MNLARRLLSGAALAGLLLSGAVVAEGSASAPAPRSLQLEGHALLRLGRRPPTPSLRSWIPTRLGRILEAWRATAQLPA